MGDAKIYCDIGEGVKGYDITLVISLGSNAIKVENYVGKNFEDVEKMLEDKGLYVFKETVEVDEKNNKYKKGTIISQSVKEGTLLNEGDSITFKVPDIVVNYPDFTTGYNKTSIDEFCSKYDLNCSYSELETTDYTPGTIIKQSRAAGTVVTAKASLVITIAVAPTIVEGE